QERCAAVNLRRAHIVEQGRDDEEPGVIPRRRQATVGGTGRGYVEEVTCSDEKKDPCGVEATQCPIHEQHGHEEEQEVEAGEQHRGSAGVDLTARVTAIREIVPRQSTGQRPKSTAEPGQSGNETLGRSGWPSTSGRFRVVEGREVRGPQGGREPMLRSDVRR